MTRDVSTRVVVGGLAAGAGRPSTQAEAGEIFDAAADLPHLPRRRPVRRARRDVLAEARARPVEMFMPEVVEDGDEFVLSMPPSATSRWSRPDERAATAGPAARSASAARACSRPTPSPMTLDGTNTWVLREPGAGRSVVIDPGPPDAGHLDAVRRGRRRRGGRCCSPTTTSTTPRRPGSSRSRSAAAYAPSTRRTGSATRASASGDVVAVDGLEVHVVATPGPHRRLAVVPAARRAGGAHRRHRARARHDRRRPPRRPARRLPRLARPAARARRGARGRRDLAGPRPGHRRRARRPRPLPRPPAASGSSRSRAARRASCGPEASPTPSPCRARSSRSSTPTSTRSSGAPPSSPSAPSSTTCTPSYEASAGLRFSGRGGRAARRP